MISTIVKAAIVELSRAEGLAEFHMRHGDPKRALFYKALGLVTHDRILNGEMR